MESAIGQNIALGKVLIAKNEVAINTAQPL
jgi:hypothetical protein